MEKNIIKDDYICKALTTLTLKLYEELGTSSPQDGISNMLDFYFYALKPYDLAELINRNTRNTLS